MLCLLQECVDRTRYSSLVVDTSTPQPFIPFSAVHALFTVDPPSRLQPKAEAAGVSAEEWSHFMQFVACFFGNMGNYLSFGEPLHPFTHPHSSFHVHGEIEKHSSPHPQLSPRPSNACLLLCHAGDTKFVPRCSQSSMTSIIGSSIAAAELLERWEAIVDAVYDLSPQIRQMGLEGSGIS